MVCGSEGWDFESDEQRERYIVNFSLVSDPRPTSSTGGIHFGLLPGWYIRPCKCEREGGALCRLYIVFGAGVLRSFLKRFDCYPRPIRGTKSGSVQRQRALIGAVPVTIAY
eukprot:CAMPEP_0197456710 /NCGR_PEP_ID=MMETSP1175-20131217/44056_1 /TAXON_ID=1003142 /ORGANISM="Triceratium dubium, Strain CCMP147" /LENGTH=110 /DNA_ID=CAMNT_0042990849 /DNA_START=189 /DNA_END=518 /DNA_ORIENTATION=+